MGKKNLVKHMRDGIQVRCANGQVVQCQPMMLEDAEFYLEQWDRIPAGSARVRIDARLKIVRRFAQRYPQLKAHIGMGDVENLLPGFLWRTTGATVALANGQPATGTDSTPTTSRPGANRPTAG